MLDSLKISLKLKNAYRTNSFIYSVFQLPFLNKIDSKQFYQNTSLKTLFGLFSLIIEFFKTILKRGFYLFLLGLFTFIIAPKEMNYPFLTLFFFFAIIASMCKNYMFDASKEKYYALTLINMNCQKYVLSNNLIELIKVLIGFLPLIPIIKIVMDIPFTICLLLPIFEIFIRLIVIAINLCVYDKKQTINPTLSKFQLLIIVILGIAPFVLAYNSYYITYPIFYILFIVCAILSILSIIKINKFQYYKIMYRQILNKETIFETSEQRNIKAIKNEAASGIEYDKNYTSNKTGYAYFHDLFVARHRKILMASATKQSLFIIVIIILLASISLFFNDFKKVINDTIMSSLPYFVILMYALNRGLKVTQAMFMNCDHSLLTYKFYRTPQVILGLFKQRLKTLITIDLIPASTLAIGLAILLFISGGTTNNLNYVIVAVSIICMSIFFSVHNLVLYYLFQPYNVNTESKSATLRIAQVATYYACFYISDIVMPTFIFGLLTIVFCIVYSIVSLIIVFKYAPKTFKLRN